MEEGGGAWMDIGMGVVIDGWAEVKGRERVINVHFNLRKSTE